jgi:SAM-dependent methyltransferase
VHADEYRRLYDLEDQYWWFVARRRLAITLLHSALEEEQPTPDKTIIADLGCGTGVVLKEMTSWSLPVGLDMSPIALQFCRQRGLKNLVQSDGQQLPIVSNTVNGMLALDVFEHIHRDDLAFAEAFRILKPGGVLVLSVPAFKTLWGPHDVALMHIRRYRRKQIISCLEQTGFEVEKTNYSIFLLFPLVVLTRVIDKFKRGEPKASLPSIPKVLNAFLVRFQDAEAWLLRRMRLPWGSSVVAIARKPRT